MLTNIVQKYKIYFLFGILILAGILRFYSLSSSPPSLNWDETSIGYNAYSILKTGKDEYGKFLPLEFRSFDDYKPPVYIYLTVPAIAVFGLNELAVRFPAALFGTFSVLVFYLLISEIFKNKKNYQPISLIGSFLLAISPWHLQFSRAAYEANVGLFCLMLGLLLFFKGLQNKWWLIASVLSFVLCLYSYHSFRLILPIFLPIIAILYFKELLRKKMIVIISAILLIVLSLPVYVSFINPQGSKARLAMVSIFIESDSLREDLQQLEIDKSNNNIVGTIFHNRRAFFAREITKNYFDHFNPNFLFADADGSFHHRAVDMGMMYLIEAPFLLFGIYFLGRNFNKKILVLIILLLLAPIPASLTTGTPHAVRAISMLPVLVILSGCGIFLFLSLIKSLKNKVLRQSVFIIFILLFIANFAYYLNQYYTVTPRVYGYFWEKGNKEAIQTALKTENDVNKIVMTYKYDQPYIYYLFYGKIDPAWYQKNWDYKGDGSVDRMRRVIGKYEFRNIDFSKDVQLKNSLLIGTPDEIPESGEVISTIYFPDGRVAYRIYKTK